MTFVHRKYTGYLTVQKNIKTRKLTNQVVTNSPAVRISTQRQITNIRVLLTLHGTSLFMNTMYSELNITITNTQVTIS